MNKRLLFFVLFSIASFACAMECEEGESGYEGDVEVFCPEVMTAQEREIYLNDCRLERFVNGKSFPEDLRNPIVKKLIKGLEKRKKKRLIKALPKRKKKCDLPEEFNNMKI